VVFDGTRYVLNGGLAPETREALRQLAPLDAVALV
jgi:hypothetical protein